MSTWHRRAALADHPLWRDRPASGAEPQVTIALREPAGLLQVSAFARDVAAASERLVSALGIALPLPNRMSGDDALNVRSTGPGIWQVAGSSDRVPTASVLRVQMESVATVVDLGHARTAFRVSGPRAMQTLAKHCPLDLDARVFPPGSATSTRFNQLGMTLARIDPPDHSDDARRDSPAFELMVFRGYAVFVFEALVESAREFGVAIEG